MATTKQIYNNNNNNNNIKANCYDSYLELVRRLRDVVVVALSTIIQFRDC